VIQIATTVFGLFVHAMDCNDSEVCPSNILREILRFP
jgi:hypothetical protein